MADLFFSRTIDLFGAIKPAVSAVIAQEKNAIAPGDDTGHERRRLRASLTWNLFLAELQHANFELKRRRFTHMGDIIGQGAYWMAYRYEVRNGERLDFLVTHSYEHLEAGTVVTLKRIKPKRADEEQANNTDDIHESTILNAITTEIRVLSKSRIRDHNNIVSLLCLFWEDRGSDAPLWPTMVMEYYQCTVSELLVNSATSLSLSIKFSLIQGIESGVAALHSEGIVHGDLKCDNVLVHYREDGFLVPKLGDFGNSIILVKDSQFVEVGGTNPWRAPEVIARLLRVNLLLITNTQCLINDNIVSVELASATDLYSFGLLIWVIIGDGKNPFQHFYDLCNLGADPDTEKCCDTSMRPYRFTQMHNEARLSANDRIQKYKEEEDCAALATADARELYADEPGLCDRLSAVWKVLLRNDPQTRVEMFATFMQDVGLAVSIPCGDQGNEEAQLPRSVKDMRTSIHPDGMFTYYLVEFIRKEYLDFHLSPGEPTKKQVFRELSQFLSAFDRERSLVCEACCSFSTFDMLEDSSSVTISMLYDFILEQGHMDHTCITKGVLTVETTSTLAGGQIDEVFSLILNLFTCYADGYGVRKNIDEGLKWLAKGATWGSALFQVEFPRLFLELQGCLPRHLPVKKWLILSVLLFDYAPAKKLLGAMDAPVLQLAVTGRARMFGGHSVSITHWDLGSAIKSLGESNFRGIEHQLHSEINSAANFYDPENGNNILHHAVSNWSEPVLYCQELLRRNPRLLNAQNLFKETPLLLACRGARLSMVSLLLAYGADATITAGEGGEYPLHWLTQCEHSFGVISEMLEQGVDIEAQCTVMKLYPGKLIRSPSLMPNRSFSSRGSPLQWAVQIENVPMVNFLLENGANPNRMDCIGSTALSAAISIRNSHIVAACLKCQKEGLSDLKLLRELFADTTMHTRYLLGFAWDAEVQIIIDLLDHTPRVSGAADLEAMFYAPISLGIAVMPFRSLMQLLDGFERILRSCSDCDSNKPLARPSWKGKSMDLILTAVMRNDIEILELVLQKGIDLTEITASSETCLHNLASHKGSRDCLETLLKYGADPRAKTTDNYLPIHYALFSGCTELADAMVEKMSLRDFEDAFGNYFHQTSPGYPVKDISCNFFGQLLKTRSLAGRSVKGIEWMFSLPKLIKQYSVSWSHDPRALEVLVSVTDAATVASPRVVSPLHLAADGLDDNEGVFRAYGLLPVFICILQRFRTTAELDCKNKHGFTALHIVAWLGKFEETRLLVEAGASINAHDSRCGTPLDITFSGPPRYYAESKLGPSREMVARFMRGRNEVAQYLRQHGALSLQEIQTGVSLGTWVPFPLGVDASLEYRPFMACLLMGRLQCWMYGRIVEPPKFTKPGVLPGVPRRSEIKGPV